MSFLRRFSVAVSKKLTVTTTSEPSQDFGLATLSAIMSVGCVALILMTFFGNYPETHSQWGNIGLAMSIGLCSLLCGGFMGFLFGIPRTLQKAALDTGESGRSIKERAYGNNTNLEQISDWLTKIIVGVSLTQLPAIQKGFVAIASSVADGFAFFSPKMALAFAGTLIVFYSVCGFLYVYLWCKIYFIRQLETQDQDMAKVYARVEKVTDDLNRKIEDNKENSARNLRISELNRRIMNFEKAVTRLLTSENTIPELKEWLQTFRPKRPLIEDDIQKGGVS
ncbi:MAG: hypothetical protein EOP04_09260 [Proteobacteria bacterium]|nr:MAG: hypothetical protein EOP04_09260 [Pseudomonadota bacterium]